MFEIIEKYDELKRVLKGSHVFYNASDIKDRNQFFTDKSVDVLIFSDGENEFLDKALFAFGNVDVKVFADDMQEMKLGSFSGGKAIVYIPKLPVQERKRFDFNDLISIMTRLRAKDGCEWDKAQTHESIRINLIEEAYELLEAIDAGDKAMMLEETGDVLLQAVFHTHVAMDNGEFDYGDMLYELCNKLITRHTHIFGQNHAENADEALNFWNDAKKKEKQYTSYSDSMNRVPKNLPSLMYANKVQKRAKKCGFDFPSADDALLKVKEELNEILSAKSESEITDECGDLLFAVVNYLRLLDIEPELTLKAATEKFMRRFAAMEDYILSIGKNLDECSLAEMDEAWGKVKEKEKCKSAE
ncbi:MAG: nucleoside triphosphate pyrophosphohydrolase [Christensenellales bacterium]